MYERMDNAEESFVFDIGSDIFMRRNTQTTGRCNLYTQLSIASQGCLNGHDWGIILGSINCGGCATPAAT